ncbi:MAG: Dihydropteroate synthase [Nocardioides sp.]|jgi:dihydropteroate synthase|uniref:dihydropteroate synthase n=1 Tax=Nocardioides sp. TaxID=35761 RepID=UPI0026117B81|nr:dihydropteroate synthase [Nocardioides sp.]MCW2835772.1 Dihydropteroate synthase [Nocardioides sp.]
MAIVNLTKDSFYPPARSRNLDAAMAAVDGAVADGADIVDLGAVRAGQVGAPVSADEEISRLLPVLTALRDRFPELLVSVDTWRSEVVSALSDLRIDIVNDTWAGADPELVFAAAECSAAIVCSHTGGLPPRTDPVDVTYGPEPDGVVDDVVATLLEGAARAAQAGIPANRVLLDPTLDFGKTTRHSLAVLRATPRIVALGHPVMQAISRKDFVGETLDLPVEDRLFGSLGATAVAAWMGVCLFRSHDVLATRQVLDMVSSIAGHRPPLVAVRGEPVLG